MCEQLQKLMSSKTLMTWNASYQTLFDKDNSLINNDAWMKFYDETKPLFLETDVSRSGLGVALLQTRDELTCPRDIVPDNTIHRPIAFANKSLTSMEHRHSHIKREALGILHGLERFCHYCFAGEVSIITNHKPLVVILKKDAATLSQKYKVFASGYTNSESEYYTSLNQIFHHRLALQTQPYKRNKDAEIPGMDIKVDAIQTATNIPDCICIQFQQETTQDNHLQ